MVKSKTFVYNEIFRDLLCELTRLVGAVEDLIVEDGEVEGQAQPNGVGRLHLALADIKCILHKGETQRA